MFQIRIHDVEIRLREPVMQPDALIIQDPTLLHQVDLFNGLSPDGYILINSTRSFDELGIEALTFIAGGVLRTQHKSFCNPPDRVSALLQAGVRRLLRCAPSRSVHVT